MIASTERLLLDATTLAHEHPPEFFHDYKSALFDLACPDGAVGREGAGPITVTRWPAWAPERIELPARLDASIEPNYYPYEPVSRDGEAMEWHVNFADADLFCAYGTGLFAQDESQVAEHPALACVREALLARGLSARTRDRQGPTPILVANVERRLAIDTTPNPDAGRPSGIYGQRFARAPFRHVRDATRVLDPPTRSNIIALAAPAYGQGRYTTEEIAYAFVAALSGFAAARAESQSTGRAVIHSGFWGCGAFGGNRELMIALQGLAAGAARVEHLVLHVGDARGAEQARAGLERAATVARELGPACSLDALVLRCVAFGDAWGVSDGN